MRIADTGPCFMVLLAVVASGCYMNLQGTDSEVITRVDALEQRVSALEQGRPPPLPPAVSSKQGRVTAAEYTEDEPEANAGPGARKRPVGRRRLKEPPRPTTAEGDDDSSPDYE